MPKETYYFSHDFNARHDRKIAALVKDYKSSGYGIYWATAEMMHEEGGGIEFDDMSIGAISKDLNEDENMIRDVLEKCVNKYKLFTKQNFVLQSGRVLKNLGNRTNLKQNKADAGRLGGIKSGESRRSKKSPKQTEADRSGASSNEAKERKGKEKKENGASRGIGFSEDGLSVFFEDGSSQALGQTQQSYLKEGGYEPHRVKKGIIE